MIGRRADVIDYLCSRMQGLYSSEECRHIARMAAAAWSNTDESRFLIEPNEIIEISDLESRADELAAGCPIQYILGQAEFCGEIFAVRSGVLIPRPETEELVMWAIEKSHSLHSPRILDVCTGSGCIAIALKKRIPTATLTAIELSQDALAIAKENAAQLHAEVEFIKDDALHGMHSIDGREFDIIISNPPYIPQSEISAMRINVTQYEPHMALFVDDDDPLIFYREIARTALRLLTSNGWLMFEIHETLADKTMLMLADEGYTDIELREDFRQKPRMICCRPKRE